MAIVATVLYLSFFQPPSIEMPVFLFPHIDKVVHLCMYGGLSGVLWLEFLLNHRRQMIRWHGWIGAVLCPLLMSGVIELLQMQEAMLGIESKGRRRETVCAVWNDEIDLTEADGCKVIKVWLDDRIVTVRDLYRIRKHRLIF